MRPLYWLQLQFTVAILRQLASVHAIILRRPAVLRDAYPGDSDLDVTIILADSLNDSAIRRLGRAVRAVKRACPLLGELWLVPLDRWTGHYRYHVTDYQGSLHESVRWCRGRDCGRFAVLEAGATASERRKKKRDLLTAGIEQIWQWYGVEPLLAARRIMKLDHKIARLETANGRLWAPGSYGNFGVVTAVGLVQERARLIHRLTSQRVAAGAAFMTVQVRGGFTGLCTADLAVIRGCYRTLQRQGVIGKASIFPTRPYAFQFAVRTEDVGSTGARLLSQSLSQSEVGFSPPYCLNFSASTWEWYLEHDALMRLCQALWSFDLRQDAAITTPLQTFALDFGTVLLELAECLDMIDSTLRGQATHYLIDLCVAAKAYVQVLRTQVFVAGRMAIALAEPYSLATLLPVDLLAAYAAGDLRRADSHSLTETWLKLRPLITWLNVEAAALFAAHLPKG